MGAPQSLRQRYIVFEVLSDLSRDELQNIISELSDNIGFSYRPWLVLYDRDESFGLLKCRHSDVEAVLKGLTSFSDLEIEVKGVSGTIEKARKKFFVS